MLYKGETTAKISKLAKRVPLLNPDRQWLITCLLKVQLLSALRLDFANFTLIVVVAKANIIKRYFSLAHDIHSFHVIKKESPDHGTHTYTRGNLRTA